jgi:hypothetical protein
MSSHSQSHFQPPPPIRTSTVDSQTSGTMSHASETLSPTSTYTRGSLSDTSSAEDSFFGAIASRIRRGRSRSRSRAGASRMRSKSPLVLPPEQLPSRAHAQPTKSTYPGPRTQKSRHASGASQSSVSAAAPKPTRPSLKDSTRQSSSGSDMWRGRHSNTWLFNDFSVTDTTKQLFQKSRKS